MSDIPDHLKRFGLRIRREPIRGTAHLKVSYLRADDPRLRQTTQSGQEIVTGIAVEKLRAKLGGNEGYFIGPTEERHFISIPPDLPDGEGIVALLEFRIRPIDKRSDA